jgi:hypothetical protein
LSSPLNCNRNDDYGTRGSGIKLANGRMEIGTSSLDHRHVIPHPVQSIVPMALTVNSSVPLNNATTKQAAYS